MEKEKRLYPRKILERAYIQENRRMYMDFNDGWVSVRYMERERSLVEEGKSVYLKGDSECHHQFNLTDDVVRTSKYC